GAALATTLARVVEMLFIVGYVYISKNKIAATLKELYSFDLELVKIYFKTSWSVIANELVFSIGMTAFSMAYARIGTNAVATMQIATTLNNIFTVLLMGMAAATAIMVGNRIGADDEVEARNIARNIGWLTPMTSAVLALVIWMVAPLVLKPFNVGPETYADTLIVLRLMAVFLPIRAFNMVMIVGVFRGGGDTLYSMLVQAGTLWLYAVPLAFLGATALGLSVISVYFLVCTEECVKVLFELKRLRSGKWIHNIIK
ncbi:MAG: MATE family efflux transporter, partial [Cellulosilyticaceae bacterium]